MDVIIGIDPHKASHTAVAVGRRRGRARPAAGAQRPQPGRPAVGLGGAVRARDDGRSRAPRVSGSCWRSSSSPPTRSSSTCRPRWRRGHGCWAAVGRTRTTPTTRCRWRSPRCGTGVCARSYRPAHASCCGCWRSATSTCRTNAPGSCRACTPCGGALTRRDRQGAQLDRRRQVPRHASPRPTRSRSSATT